MTEELIERIKLLEARVEKLEGKKKPAKGTTSVGQIREIFLKAYAVQFKHEYTGWGAKENGLASNWLKSVSFDKACWLIKWYMVWHDQYVTREGHPFHLLTMQSVKLESQLQRGGKYFEQVAASQVAHKENIGREATKQEVMVHAQRSRTKDNLRVGFGGVGELQEPARQGVLGESTGTDRREVRHGDGKEGLQKDPDQV